MKVRDSVYELDLSDAMLVGGAVLAVLGCAFVSWALALVVAGLLCGVGGVLVGRAGRAS